jgi:hypothetical protein
MRIVSQIIGGLAIIALSFFGTLYFLDYQAPRTSADAVRASTAKTVMAALEKYRAAKGSYPVTSGPLSALAPALVGGGFVAAIPPDPPGEPTQYASFDGAVYGLLIKLDRNERPCIVEPANIKTGFWGAPSCGF